MPNKLSDVMLRQIRATEKEQNLADGDGLYFRVLPLAKGGATSFYYRYIFGGRQRRYNCGSYPDVGLAQARKLRDQVRLQVAQGIDPSEERKVARLSRIAAQLEANTEPSVNELFERWEAIYLKLHRKDGGTMLRGYFEKDIQPHLGKLKAKQITRRHVGSVLDRIVARGAKRKANAVLSMLKQMFKWAYIRGIVEIDPTYGYTKKDVGGHEKPRERNLSNEEIVELLEKLPHADLSEQLQAAIRLLLATGVRVGELCSARWGDVDLEAGTWVIPETHAKNKRRFTIPLSAYAMKQLHVLRSFQADDFVLTGSRFHRAYSDKALTRLIRDRNRDEALSGRTKLAGSLKLTGGTWTPHDLRRTMASRMGDLGIAPHIIERCLNHVQQGIVAVYQRQRYEHELAEAFRRWGEQLEQSGSRSGYATRNNNVVTLRPSHALHTVVR